jgi:hypothetical protein
MTFNCEKVQIIMDEHAFEQINIQRKAHMPTVNDATYIKKKRCLQIFYPIKIQTFTILHKYNELEENK